MSRPTLERWPDFFIAGFARCGTTALWSSLRAHPELFMSQPKEPQFFAADLDSGTRGEGRLRVRERSAYLALFEGARPEQIVGEASTSTLFSHAAVPAILAVNPAARFIVSLRDPAEVVASFHAQMSGAGYEDVDLETALDGEEERRHGRGRSRRPTFPWPIPYLAYASYGEQISRLLDSVSHDRLLVVLLEDMVADRRTALARVTDFLGVSELADDVPFDRNAHRRMRLRPLFDAVYSPLTVSVAKRLVPMRARSLVTRSAGSITYALRPTGRRSPVAPATRDRIRAALREDLAHGSRLVGQDLVARWWNDQA